MEKNTLPQRRPQGIVILGPGTDSDSYAGITRKLKDSMDLDTLGVKVTKLRRTKLGAITMTVRKGKGAALEAERL